MWRRILGSALFLVLSQLGFAQFTNVSGTVHDPIGLPYAYGTIVPLLNISGTPVFTSTGKSYFPPQEPSGLDVNGNFIVRIADNTSLSPSSSTWTFVICSGSGTVPVSWGRQLGCFSVGPITISGSSQDISVQIQSNASPLTYSASAILQDSSASCAKLNGPVDLDTSHLDGTGQATAAASDVNSTSVIGVAVSIPEGTRCIGSVQVATGLVVPCITDNTSTVGDTIAVSASVAGECTDTGGTSLSSGTFGSVVRANAGPGTVSMVLLTLKSGSGTGSPGAPVNSLQYNCASSFCGLSAFQWDSETGTIDAINNSSGLVVGQIGVISNALFISPVDFAPGTGGSRVFIGDDINNFADGGFVSVGTFAPGNPTFIAGGADSSGNRQDMEEFTGSATCNGVSFPTGFGVLRGLPGSAQFCWDGNHFAAPTLPASDNTANVSTDAFVHSYAPQKIISGIAALGTSAISATSCATVVTVSATGALTSDAIRWSFNSAPGAGYTSGLVVSSYPTANNVNFLVCNPTAGSVTPTAATLNWAVDR